MIQIGVAVALALSAAIIAARLRLGLSRELVIAGLRAALQLASVGALITLVFEHAALGGLFALVMAGAATVTSGRRLRGVPGRYVRAGAAITGGALVGLVPLVATGAFSTAPRELVPIAGILIGGAMVATSVTGRQVLAGVEDRVAEIETRLALGASVRDAVGGLTRTAVTTGIVPVIDQTKNAGLVTLPGTFVGLVLGGASPAEAARVQLVVLLALLAVELVAALMCAWLVVAGLTLPGERVLQPARRPG